MNPEQLLHRAGYVYIRDRRTGQESLVHRLGKGFYPRFHLYLEDRGEQIILNLHLDQKQPIYEGMTAHNAEYDGEVVEGEAKRIKSFISYNSQPITSENNEPIDDESLFNKIRPKQFSDVIKKEEKKSWWRFWE